VAQVVSITSKIEWRRTLGNNAEAVASDVTAHDISNAIVVGRHETVKVLIATANHGEVVIKAGSESDFSAKDKAICVRNRVALPIIIRK